MTATLSTVNLIRPANAPRQSGLLAVARHLRALWATRQQAAAQHQRARQAALDAAQVRQMADAVRASNPGFAADLDAAAARALPGLRTPG
jgi:hypothetical protein